MILTLSVMAIVSPQGFPSGAAPEAALWLPHVDYVGGGETFFWERGTTAPNTLLSGNDVPSLADSLAGANTWLGDVHSPTYEPAGLNGRPCIYFAGNSSHYCQLYNGATTRNIDELIANDRFTVVMVLKPAAFGAGAGPDFWQQPAAFGDKKGYVGGFIGAAGGTDYIGVGATTGGVAYKARLAADTAARIVTFQLIPAAVHASGNATLRVRFDDDVAQQAEGQFGVGGAQTITDITGEANIGAVSRDFAGQFANFRLSAAFFFNSIPSDADLSEIIGALAWRAGLQARLPVGHAYAAAPPTSGTAATASSETHTSGTGTKTAGSGYKTMTFVAWSKGGAGNTGDIGNSGGGGGGGPKYVSPTIDVWPGDTIDYVASGVASLKSAGLGLYVISTAGADGAAPAAGVKGVCTITAGGGTASAASDGAVGEVGGDGGPGGDAGGTGGGAGGAGGVGVNGNGVAGTAPGGGGGGAGAGGGGVGGAGGAPSVRIGWNE